MCPLSFFLNLDSAAYTWPLEKEKMVRWVSFNFPADVKVKLSLMQGNTEVSSMVVSDLINDFRERMTMKADVPLGLGYAIQLCADTGQGEACWKSGLFSVVAKVGFLWFISCPIQRNALCCFSCASPWRMPAPLAVLLSCFSISLLVHDSSKMITRMLHSWPLYFTEVCLVVDHHFVFIHREVHASVFVSSLACFARLAGILTAL